jgi:general secretion pathway protein D
MDFPEAISLNDFIVTMGRRFGKNIILDPGISGKLQIIAPKELSREDAEQVFLSALNYLGYTTVETGQITKVMRVADGQKKENPLVKPGVGVPRSDQVVTYYLPLHYLSAQAILPVISPLITSQGLTVAPGGSALIICDSGININRLLKIISLLDVKNEHEQIEVIKIVSLEAEAMLKRLRELVKPTGGSGPRATAPLAMVAEPSSNAIVLLGAKLDITRTKDLIAELDKVPAPYNNDERFFIRPVDFLDANKLAATLQALSIGGGGRGTSLPAAADSALPPLPLDAAPPAAAPAAAAPGAPAGNSKIMVDADTNSLLIKGTRGYYHSVDSIVRKLDKRRALVFYTLDILEISQSHNLTLGTAYTHSGSFGTSGGESIKWVNSWHMSQVAPFLPGPATSSNTLSSASAMVSTVSQGATIGAIGKGGVNIPGFGDVSPTALLQLVKTDANSRTLSSPKLMAVDNEQTNLTVGDALYFNTTITDRAGTKLKKVQKENVDLVVDIKGHITGENDIDIDLKLTASTVLTITDEGVPQVGKQVVKQKVNIPQQTTVVIVGFDRSQVTESTTKVPLLGDIPLLGVLFRRQIRNVQGRQLAIFITPYIVRNSEDLAKINQKSIDEKNELFPDAPKIIPNGKNFSAD